MPEMPKAKEPNALPAWTETRSVTKNLPGGVRDAGAPVAAGKEKRARPSRKTVIRCFDRSTWTEYGVWLVESPFMEIQPVASPRPLNGSVTRPNRPPAVVSRTQATVGW